MKKKTFMFISTPVDLLNTFRMIYLRVKETLPPVQDTALACEKGDFHKLHPKGTQESRRFRKSCNL